MDFRVFVVLVSMLSVAATACSPADAPSEKYAEFRAPFEFRSDAVGETYGKIAAPEKTVPYYEPKFFSKLDFLERRAVDPAAKFYPLGSVHWHFLWIYPREPVVGETIYASSVFSNVMYRSDRLQFIRYELCDKVDPDFYTERRWKLPNDDAQYFAVDPFSGELSWKKIPPRGRYQFTLTVKAFDASRPELFDKLTAVFACTRED